MQHCKREYCNAGTRQWSQRGIYIRKASKAKNSEQIIIRSNDSRYRGYPKTEKNAIQQRGVVTIQEAVTGFLAEKENTIKLSSYLRYEQMLRKHILPSLGRVCVDQLSTKAFTSFLQQKQIDSELSQKTLKDIGTLLKGVLKYAETTFNCSSPAHGAKLPKYRQNMPEIFSDAEINSIANRVLDVPSILGIAILLTLNSGLRLGELCALRWSDIDFSSGVISVQRTVQRLTVDGVGKLVIQPPKSLSSLRRIPIPADMLALLKQVRLSNSIDSFLMTGTDAPMAPRTCQYQYKLFLKECGVHYRNFHILRHPYVKHTTKIFSLRLMDFQAQAYPDARRKTRGACQLLRGGQSRSPVRPLCNRERFSYLPPQSKMSWILYAISIRLSGYTSTRSISSSASSVVSVSASKIALDASMRLSCRACSSCFCFACANTAA